MIEMFVYLIMGHALADFALQSEAMARGKNFNRKVDLSKIPPGQKVQTVWPYWMASHCLIHGGVVALITGSFALGLAEASAHWLIDCMKCMNATGIHTDQALHVLSKLVWILVIVSGNFAVGLV